MCSRLGCSGNFFVDYAVLELREIYLPLPRAGTKGVHHHHMAMILKRSTWGMECKVNRYYLADYANRVKECPCLFFWKKKLTSGKVANQEFRLIYTVSIMH